MCGVGRGSRSCLLLVPSSGEAGGGAYGASGPSWGQSGGRRKGLLLAAEGHTCLVLSNLKDSLLLPRSPWAWV